MEIDTVSMDGVGRYIDSSQEFGNGFQANKHLLSRRSNHFLSQWVLLYISLVEKTVNRMGFHLIIHSTYDTCFTDNGLIYDTVVTVQNNRLVLGSE